MILIIKPDGMGRAVYDEALDLSMLGRINIQRASVVEPGYSVGGGSDGANSGGGVSGGGGASGGGGGGSGGWWADLTRVGGPHLGPYAKRSQALAAEREWLEHHLAELPIRPESH